MAIASLVAGWNRRQSKPGIGINAPGPMHPAGQPFDTGPAGPIGLTVELCFDPLGEIWTDISRYVYYRDRIKIGRGRSDETTQPQPQSANLTLNNRDGRFSPRNPVGLWYGMIGRNTPIRVSRKVNGSDTPYYRFWGEVPSWPTTSEISGADVNTPIQASGILRRLNQGSPTAYSAFYRAVSLGIGISNCLAYWPCEDGANSTSLASIPVFASPPANSMVLSGQASPTFASFTGFLCSEPLPLLSGSIWTGAIPADTFGGAANPANVLRFLLGVPTSGAYDMGVVARLFTTGTVARLDVQYGVLNNGSLQLAGYDRSGTQLFATGYGFANLDNTPIRVSMEMVQSGSTVVCSLVVLVVGSASGSFIQHTVSAATLGSGTGVVINPDGHINDTAVGHITYQDDLESLFNLADALNAQLGEMPVNRFLDLCFELPGTPPNSATFNSAFSDTTVTMGYQLPGAFPALVQEVMDTDGGILLEARDQNQLLMRQRVSMYNQTPTVTLDLSQHQLSAPLAPEDDDRFTRNLITVTRTNGSSHQTSLTSGALSIAAPPSGVGPYESTISLSLGTDAQTIDQAGWRLMLGTTDRERYPQVSVNLRHPTFTSNPVLTQAILNVEVGDTIKLVNLPSWLPPDPALLIVQGYSETLGIYEHDITFNCSPADPYQIAILEDPVLGHADTDGSLLAHTYPLGTETTIQVVTTGAATGSPLWTTNVADFPFDIAVGGERMTVTNITGAASPQTFTVTRSVNGVVKSQAAATDVRLWQPMVLSL